MKERRIFQTHARTMEGDRIIRLKKLRFRPTECLTIAFLYGCDTVDNFRVLFVRHGAWKLDTCPFRNFDRSTSPKTRASPWRLKLPLTMAPTPILHQCLHLRIRWVYETCSRGPRKRNNHFLLTVSNCLRLQPTVTSRNLGGSNVESSVVWDDKVRL